MARINVAEGLVESLKSATGFSASEGGTVTLGDERALAMGVHRMAMVMYDSFSNQWDTFGGDQRIEYSFSVEVYIRHAGDVLEARRDAHTYVGHIINRIANDQTLGGSAFTAIAASGTLEDEALEYANVPFLLETVTVRATEHLDV